MKSILRSTIILSGSSLVSIVVGLASAKVWALLLGPSGIGYLGLLQGLVGLAGLVAGLGVGAGLVSIGAHMLAEGDRSGFAALRKAGWLLFWAAAAIAILILAILRVPISRLMLGGPEHSTDVVLMGLAMLFSLASGVQTSLLNAHHRVSALARVGALTSLLGAAISLAAVWLLRERGVALSVIGSAAASWGVSSFILRRGTGREHVDVSREALFAATRSLFRFGPPYALSQLVGVGVQFALPALVLSRLGIDGVGYYRAAISVAGVYLGFLLLAMAQDYYPRVSAASSEPVELRRLVNEQHRLVMLLGIPIILATLTAAPILIELIYSPAFLPAVEVLEWQLIGDIFKFSSWTMGFVILARRQSRTLFLVELLAGLNFLWTAELGTRWLGLAGLGASYLFTYVVHFLVVWLIVRKEIGLSWTLDNKLMLLAGLVASLAIRGLSLAGPASLRTPIALALVALAGTISLATIWQGIGGLRSLREWRQRA